MSAPAAAAAAATAVRWCVRPPARPSDVERLSAALSIHPRLAAVLLARGWDEATARARLDTPLTPSAIPNLPAAAERIVRARARGERILVHGDYDADGVTATAVLTLGLRALGAHVTPFIPHRLRDGYGIHPDRVAEHAAACDLFVAVDCGIGNVTEIAALARAGIEAIVVDHHTRGSVLPDALIVHPGDAPGAVPGAAEPTGAGLAYHLLWWVHRTLGLDDPTDLLDVAAIGTVADVAKLHGENRALVRAGLARLGESRWPGLRATMSIARIAGPVTARDVAFKVAPRLNAAGRLGEADAALALLLESHESRALALAARIDALNRERMTVQETMLADAQKRVDPNAPALVLTAPGWHVGVMGLVASGLLERHRRPVFIVADGKGSVRSTPGISAVGALRAAAPHLLRYGGHAAAAGFALDMDRFDDFAAAVNAFVATHEPAPATLVADALLGGDDVTLDLLGAAAELEPFGEGHDPPIYALSGPVARARAVGANGAHLSLLLGSDAGAVKGIAFRHGAAAPDVAGSALDVQAELTLNDWNGVKSAEFQARGFRRAETWQLGDERGPVVGPARSVRRGAAGAAGVVTLDPDAADPLAPARDALARGETVAVALDAGAWQRAAAALPSVSGVREAFVRSRRGQAIGATERAILLELGLLDAHGRAVSRKVSPFGSPTLRGALGRALLLSTVAQAFLRLDDVGFERTLRRACDLPDG